MKKFIIFFIILLLPTSVLFAKLVLNIKSIDLSEYDNNSKIIFYCTVDDFTGFQVKNLKKDNFKIKLANLKKDFQINDFTVENVLPTDEPIYIVLLIDTSQSMLKNNAFLEAKKAAINFVENLREIDKVMIISFSDNVVIREDFNNNKEKLKEVINNLETGEYTKLYDALNLGLEKIREVISKRKFIVLLSDGKDSIEEGFRIGSNSKIEDVLRRCETYNIPIYSIGLGDADLNILERISTLSKGMKLYAPESTQLKDLYYKILDSLKDTYKISFYDPMPASKIDFRKILIEVNFDGNNINSEKVFIVKGTLKEIKSTFSLSSIIYLIIILALITLGVVLILYRKRTKSSVYYKSKEDIKVDKDKKEN